MKTLQIKSKQMPKMVKDVKSKVFMKGKVQKVSLWSKKGQTGFMNLFVGLMFAYMIIALLGAMIPAFKLQIISATSYATGLNCVGAADYNASAAAFTGGTSATGCLALGLFIPFIILAVLMAVICKMLYDRGGPTPGYG